MAMKNIKKGDMVWEAVYQDANSGEIKLYNVLVYREEFVKKLKKTVTTKEEFSEKLRTEMMYYFWSKCEWETVLIKENNMLYLTQWVGKEAKIPITELPNVLTFDWFAFYECLSKETLYSSGIKIDVFDQLSWYWSDFVDYCWTFHHKWQRKPKEEKANAESVNAKLFEQLSEKASVQLTFYDLVEEI